MKALLGVAVLVLPTVALAAADEHGLGRKVENFQLREFRGAPWSLHDLANRKLVVLAFLGNGCPLAGLYGPRLVELAREYEPKGVAFIGINANEQDSPTAIGDYVRTHGIAFPILKDAGNVIADRLGAERTPEVFVLDEQRVVRYRGRVDDQYGIGYAARKPQRRDLALALDELLAGKPVSQPFTPAVGCKIGRAQREVKSEAVTYSKHIAPIFQKRCVECHRPGEIGPFSMTSYDEVVGWADTIEEVVRERRMPPWHASPEYGHFSNEAGLSAEEKTLIFDWIRNGAPQGDPKDLPAPVSWASGWRTPRPDVVIPIPKPITVPATGDVPYQFVVVDPGFTEDKWVQAAEVRPGCRAVVHHILVFAQPPGGWLDKYGGFAANWLAGHVPGKLPMILPEGQAKRIPAGSRLLFQIHYTPNGAVQTDRSEVGLVFADPKTVRQEVSTEMVANPSFTIPPHDPNYRVEAKQSIRQDTLLLNMTPHTHLRGKAFRYEAIYPDGKQEVLLDLPRYDFNWQNTYILAEPKLLPRGTKLHCVAVYDNSSSNRSNPNPDVKVRWGDQTWEEMMIGYYDAVVANQDLQKHPRPASTVKAPEKAPLDPELQRLAEHALDSEEQFAAFARAVHKLLPKVDRVCLTTVTNGRLRVDRASYPGDVKTQVALAGFESKSKGVTLGDYALIGSYLVNPDLSKARGVDLRLMRQTLSSSAHAPVVVEGRPGTLNFWSKEKNAFPKDIRALLQALADAVTHGR